MAYEDLGPSITPPAFLDPNNRFTAGCWTIAATSDTLKSKVGLAEIYQITIAGGPVGSSFLLYRNQQLWNTVLQGWANNYDPFNPLYIRDGDSLFFYWNSTSAPAPVANIWMRFDPDNPANKYPGPG